MNKTKGTPMTIEIKKPSLISKMTDQEYFSLDRLSNSFLIGFDRSPAHAFTPWEETAGMRAGTMFHSFILQPEEFEKNYLVVPKVDKRTKEFKDLQTSNPDKEIICQNDIQDLTTARQNIYSYDFEGVPLSNSFQEGEKEISILFPYLGEEFKSKIDCLYECIDGTFIIFDLKKTQNCQEFQKSLNNYKYYRQAQLYIEAVSIAKSVPVSDIRFIFVTVEESAPNGVMTYELSPEYIHRGEKETFQSVELYKAWKERGSNKTELYPQKVTKLFPPNWL